MKLGRRGQLYVAIKCRYAAITKYYGLRVIAGIQNDLHIEQEEGYFEPEVIFN